MSRSVAMSNEPSLTSFLRHLRTENTPLRVRRNRDGLVWRDEGLHNFVFQQDVELYALLATMEIQVCQKSRILLQLLRSSRSGYSQTTRSTLDVVIAMLLFTLPPKEVFTVFLALRKCRANHKHASRAILNYILNHPCLDELVRNHRSLLVDCLEHAAGKNSARAAAKMIKEQSNDAYSHKHLLSFASSREKATRIIPRLFGLVDQSTSAVDGSDFASAEKNKSLIDFGPCVELPKTIKRPTTVTATNRGDISSTLVHIYRGGQSPELMTGLEKYVEAASAKLPHFDGKLSLILDASASTRSYGEREYCYIAQSVALMMVLRQCCSKLTIHMVGGKGSPPIPEGETDLSSALLEALATKPEMVAIVSDGYENFYAGDLANVVASLPQMGISTPIAFCHSKFTWMDDLTLRNPAPLPQLEFWHQDDFEDLMISLIAHSTNPERLSCLRKFLLSKLAEIWDHQLKGLSFNIEPKLLQPANSGDSP